jgi:hypothetical protein
LDINCAFRHAFEVRLRSVKPIARLLGMWVWPAVS